MALKSTLKSLICLPLLALAPLVRAEGFTYPVGDTIFIEGDLVNVTWDIVSPRISLYESCAEAIPLEGMHSWFIISNVLHSPTANL